MTEANEKAMTDCFGQIIFSPFQPPKFTSTKHHIGDKPFLQLKSKPVTNMA